MSPTNPSGTMRAVGFESHGSIEKLELLEVSRPTPAEGEVLVDVKATALNHMDLFIVRELDAYVPEYPYWGGGDIAGVVDSAHETVTGWEAGDRVVVNPFITCGECQFCLDGEQSMCSEIQTVGEHRKGGYGEYVAVPAKNLISVPAHVDLTTAATVPIAGSTAHGALVRRGDVSPSDSLLVVGATGGVGSFAVKLAANVLNVRHLYGTTSTDRKAEYLRDIGVDHVINYEEDSFDERIWELTDRCGVDVVYNNVGGSTWTKSMRCLRKGGQLLTSGSTLDPQPTTEIRLIFVRQIDVIGASADSITGIEQLFEYVWNGTVQPTIDATYPLEEYRAAFQQMADRALLGKVVLSQE